MFWASPWVSSWARKFFLTAMTVVGIAILMTVLVNMQSAKLNRYLLVVRMNDAAERAVARPLIPLSITSSSPRPSPPGHRGHL